MDSNTPYRATVAPVSTHSSRPRWSVMIPTYNCASYLREALSSVLAQDPGPELMQIDVVDDHSTNDDPEAVVAELGRGRVGFYRQPVNVGHVRNFSTCVQRAQGQIVHLLHGDDLVRDGFYKHLGALFDQYPEIGAAFSRHEIIDERGQTQRVSPLERPEPGLLTGWLERITTSLPLQPPSIAVRREVYEHLGAFDSRMRSCGEDWEMWVRIALHYPVAYEPEVLAVYRDNSQSLTKRSIRSGQNIKDVRQATQIIRSYLPEPLATQAARTANESWANWALHWADQLIVKGDMRAALVQIREGLLCSQSRAVLNMALPMLSRIGRYSVKQALRRGVAFTRKAA